MTSTVTWSMLESHASHLRNVLLYGPPGTGKSFLAAHAGLPEGKHAFEIPCTADTTYAEVVGHYVMRDGSFEFASGAALLAMREGSRVVFNDVHNASDALLDTLFAVADSKDSARFVLSTTGEIVTPADGFTVWLTSNGSPDDLPDGIRDRFPVAVEVTEPNPSAVDALPPDLQPMARTLAAHPDDDRRMPMRALFEFARLRDVIGHDDAAKFTFGNRWREVIEALTLGENR